MQDLNDLYYFAKVIEHGGFSAASNALGITKSLLSRRVAELEKRGFVCDPSTAKYKGERMTAIYLKEEFGGFAVHLLQK